MSLLTFESDERVNPFLLVIIPFFYLRTYSTLYSGEQKLLLLIQDGGSGGGGGVRLPGAGIVAANAHRQPDVGGILAGIRRTWRDHRLEKTWSWSRREESWSRREESWSRREESWSRREESWSRREESWSRREELWSWHEESWSRREESSSSVIWDHRMRIERWPSSCPTSTQPPPPPPPARATGCWPPSPFLYAQGQQVKIIWTRRLPPLLPTGIG